MPDLSKIAGRDISVFKHPAFLDLKSEIDHFFGTNYNIWENRDVSHIMRDIDDLLRETLREVHHCVAAESPLTFTL